MDDPALVWGAAGVPVAIPGVWRALASFAVVILSLMGTGSRFRALSGIISELPTGQLPGAAP